MKQQAYTNPQSIIEDLASITRMERGKLTTEYRTRPNPDGSGVIKRGPYHKLQARENGKNNSRRIPLKEVPILEGDLTNHRQFKELVSSLEEMIISNTRALRAGEVEQLTLNQSKKNSAKKRVSKNIKKRKASSPKQKSG